MSALVDVQDICKVYNPGENELYREFVKRWKCILSAGAKHKADVLILGAFGCGVFANPSELVVAAFNNVLPEFRNHFETIEFAVYTTRMDAPNYQAFTGIWDVQERN